MKRIIVLLLLVMTLATVAAQKKTFLRIYNLSGKKIAKGILAGTADTSILLLNGNLINSIPVRQIGFIKTKRSVGHTILVTSLVFGATAALVTVTFSESISLAVPASEAMAGGFAYGAAIGIVPGFFSGMLKNNFTFKIDGNVGNWKKTRPIIDQLPMYIIPSADQQQQPGL